ncbi:MAG: molybdopterin-synthase adenylyltransferase MoeB [Candidatus Hydrogenedentota bacterium]
MIHVQIPTPLRRYAGGSASVDVSGSTVGEAIASLAAAYPEIGKNILGPDGKPRNFVNIYLGDEDIRYLMGLDTVTPDDSTLLIVPSIAGGAGAPSGKLTPDEMKRYSRHIILPEVGVEGQEKLKHGSVLLIGAGGLGSPLALYLAAAGVGRIGISDFDVVDYSNLQRQVIHGTSDVGKKKTESAKARIESINPFTKVEIFEGEFTSKNAMGIAKNFDIIIDGTDNFPTRYLANDVSVLLKKPNVYGSIFRFEGQASVFDPTKGGPCYRCLYPEPPPPGMVPSCAEGGVLGILPGIVGLIQATEAIKILLGQGDLLIGRLLLFDALGMKFRELKLRRNPKCPLCGDNPTIHELIDYQNFCGISAQADLPVISVEDLKARIDRGEKPFLVDVREQFEYDICNLDGKLIPLGQIPQRYAELDPNQEIVVHCKMGGRSAKAVEFLKEHGFKHVRNLEGGINAWWSRIDKGMSSY